jgi:hypothetical protein
LRLVADDRPIVGFVGTALLLYVVIGAAPSGSTFY